MSCLRGNGRGGKILAINLINGEATLWKPVMGAVEGQTRFCNKNRELHAERFNLRVERLKRAWTVEVERYVGELR